MNPFPLLLLPVELIVLVCANLPRRDLDRVQLTNRKLNRIVRKHKRYMRIENVSLHIRVFRSGALGYEILPTRIQGLLRADSVRLVGRQSEGEWIRLRGWL